jgi:uncharacterized membrane-anchored protein YjiN (DUF445 family)
MSHGVIDALASVGEHALDDLTDVVAPDGHDNTADEAGSEAHGVGESEQHTADSVNESNLNLMQHTWEEQQPLQSSDLQEQYALTLQVHKKRKQEELSSFRACAEEMLSKCTGQLERVLAEALNKNIEAAEHHLSSHLTELHQALLEQQAEQAEVSKLSKMVNRMKNTLARASDELMAFQTPQTHDDE